MRERKLPQPLLMYAPFFLLVRPVALGQDGLRFALALRGHDRCDLECNPVAILGDPLGFFTLTDSRNQRGVKWGLCVRAREFRTGPDAFMMIWLLLSISPVVVQNQISL